MDVLVARGRGLNVHYVSINRFSLTEKKNNVPCVRSTVQDYGEETPQIIGTNQNYGSILMIQMENGINPWYSSTHIIHQPMEFTHGIVNGIRPWYCKIHQWN